MSDELFLRSFYQNDLNIFQKYLSLVSNDTVYYLITNHKKYEISLLQLKYLELCFNKINEELDWWKYALKYFVLNNYQKCVFDMLKYHQCENQNFEFYFLPRFDIISEKTFYYALETMSNRSCKLLLFKYFAETDRNTPLIAITNKKERIFRILMRNKPLMSFELLKYVELYPHNLGRIYNFAESGSDTHLAIQHSIRSNNLNLFNVLYRNKFYQSYFTEAVASNNPNFYFYFINDKQINVKNNYRLFEYAIKNNLLVVLKDLMKRFSPGNNCLLELAIKHKSKECYNFICSSGFYICNINSATDDQDPFYISCILEHKELLKYDFASLFHLCCSNIFQCIFHYVVTENNNLAVAKVFLEHNIKQNFKITDIESPEMRNLILSFTKF